MNPLIKWPGGKSGEFDKFKEYIPEHKRYIEPFFGGGAVFFKLMPNLSIVNDLSIDLISFYRFIKSKNENFKKFMYSYVDIWESLTEFVELNSEGLVQLYNENNNGLKNKDYLNEILEGNHFFPILNSPLIIDKKILKSKIEQNFFSKVNRMIKLENLKGKLSKEDIEANLETGIRSGIYMYFREIYNSKDLNIKNEFRSANYFFIREFCYASMFRFNKLGQFNIPYGGIGYNRKSIRTKVDRIFDEDTLNLFSKTEIYNVDFNEILNLKLTSDDFVFLDPPYDSDFSEYEKNAFTSNDQKRLASSLYNLEAKFLMVIKNTPLIMSLYENHSNIYISTFDKKYMYNVKGRNLRDVEHLIITNYKI